MRIERRAIALIAVLLLAGATGAGGCATLLCPFYVVAVRTLSSSQGWQVVSAEVRTSQHGPGRVVALTTDFYRSPHDARSTARVVSELQVGAIAEGPIVLFSILALWPLQPGRSRWRLLLAGLPAVLLLELLTTVPQLMHAMPAVVAMVAGEPDRATLLDHWSEFLEAGGRFAVACSLAILVAVFVSRTRRRPG